MTGSDAHPHQHHTSGEGDPVDPVAHWEEVYGRREGAAVWSGNANASLVDAVESLTTPGTGPATGHEATDGSGHRPLALDLGAGEGGDAIWLAHAGWRVVAVELSPTAAARAQEAAQQAGVADDVRLVRADLSTWDPARDPATARGVDLVTAAFLHSRIDFPRMDVLRRAAAVVRPGGHLVIVSHAGAPPWAGENHDHAHLPLPQEEVDELDLPAQDWQLLTCRTREREATGPDGEQAMLVDGQVVLRRR